MIIHSKIYGKGNPFLILHGLFGMGDNWKTLGKKWSENNREVHLLDLRNHGNSFHNINMNYDLLTKDLLNYMKYYKISKSLFLGHSIGGKIIMHLSLYYPEVVKAIIVVDIAPRAYKLHHKKIIEDIKNIPLKNFKNRKNLNDFIKKNINDPLVCGLLSKNIYQNKEDKFAFRFFLPGIENNYEKLMLEQNFKKKFYGKVLFIRGDKSDYILKKDFLKIKKIFPKSKIINILKANHWVHVDNPKEVYKKVDQFLKNC